MMTWWNSLNLTEQTFACIAIPATLILILQTIFLLFSSFGGDSHDFGTGHDTDFDSDGDMDHDLHIEHAHIEHSHEHGHNFHDAGLRVFTIRGFVTFFCIFGWTGLALMRNGVNSTISIVSSIVLGFIAMIFVAFVLVQFLKLQSNGAVNVDNAIGVSGNVYLTIPANRDGKGKVSAVVSGRYSEFDAVTDENNAIPTNSEVNVVGVTGNNMLVVVKK